MLEGKQHNIPTKELEIIQSFDIYSNGNMLMDRLRRVRGTVNVEVKIDFREEQEGTLGKKKSLVLIKLVVRLINSA